MSNRAPLGWKSSRFQHHLKRVKPDVNQGMQVNLHKNINDKFLPKGTNVGKTGKGLTPRKAENIVYNQRVRGRLGGLPLPDKEFYLVKLTYRDDDDEEDTVDDSEEEYSVEEEEYYCVPDSEASCEESVDETLPALPGCRFTQQDISDVVERLSSYDRARVPESRGFPCPVTSTLECKPQTKSFSAQDIDDIVNRLNKPK